MVRLLVLFISICLVGCSHEDLHQKSQACLKKDGIPFVVYDSNGNPKDITCIKI